MSETYTLEAALRPESSRKENAQLRADAKIPAVVYGNGFESRSLVLDSVAFNKVFEAAGETSLIDLVIDGGEPVQVIVHDLQRDPLKYTITHVDLYQVRMDEEVHADVALVFEGEAPAVKKGGTMIHVLDHIEVVCLPGNLPHDIKVDVSVLATFDDTVRVGDITLPEGVRTTLDEHATVASVSAPRSDAEMEALNEEVVEDVESVGDAVEKPESEEEAAE